MSDKNEMIEKDISKEIWREYDFIDPDSGIKRVYHIDNPVTLFYYVSGHTTHRIVDKDGVAHCPPAPGHFGCVLRWKNFDEKVPVNF
jgi:hypothetical protein